MNFNETELGKDKQELALKHALHSLCEAVQEINTYLPEEHRIHSVNKKPNYFTMTSSTSSRAYFNLWFGIDYTCSHLLGLSPYMKLPTIHDLDIPQEFRGHGYGRHLVKAWEEPLIAFGYDLFTATAVSPKAKGFWFKMGYKFLYDKGGIYAYKDLRVPKKE